MFVLFINHHSVRVCKTFRGRKRLIKHFIGRACCVVLGLQKAVGNFSAKKLAKASAAAAKAAPIFNNAGGDRDTISTTDKNGSPSEMMESEGDDEFGLEVNGVSSPLHLSVPDAATPLFFVAFSGDALKASAVVKLSAHTYPTPHTTVTP